MNNSSLMGKILSQVGIFVVSCLLAGILLLAIQGNKFPGSNHIILEPPEDNDDVSPIYEEESVEENPYQEIITSEIKDSVSISNPIVPSFVNSKKESLNNSFGNQAHKESTPKPSTISRSTKSTSYPASHPQINQLTARQKLSVSAACGFSPLFFAGHNFANDFFPDSSVIFSPVSTLGITFPQKNNFTYALYLSAASSSLNLKAPQLYDNINLNFKTNFLLAKIDFSIMHKIFSEKNHVEGHFGTGIVYFNNPSCIINEVSYRKNNSVYCALDFGFSLKHFFSERFFTAVVCDFSLVFPYSEQLFIIQPALIAGLSF